MLGFYPARFPSDWDITPTGLAVNVRSKDRTDGSTDCVCCLWIPLLPEQDEFLHQTSRLLPEYRQDITSYRVHLVYRGHRKSASKEAHYRVSFYCAKMVAARHLSPAQHVTMKTVKGTRNCWTRAAGAGAGKDEVVLHQDGGALEGTRTC